MENLFREVLNSLRAEKHIKVIRSDMIKVSIDDMGRWSSMIQGCERWIGHDRYCELLAGHTAASLAQMVYEAMWVICEVEG